MTWASRCPPPAPPPKCSTGRSSWATSGGTSLRSSRSSHGPTPSRKVAEMKGALREAWRTIAPPPDAPDRDLPRLLLGLTVVTGLVDAYSFLVLGRVFVAN